MVLASLLQKITKVSMKLERFGYSARAEDFRLKRSERLNFGRDPTTGWKKTTTFWILWNRWLLCENSSRWHQRKSLIFTQKMVKDTFIWKKPFYSKIWILNFQGNWLNESINIHPKCRLLRNDSLKTLRSFEKGLNLIKPCHPNLTWLNLLLER